MLCFIKLTLSMKKGFLLICALLMTFCTWAQLPQFSNKSFEDWIYTNPATPLNSNNILGNRIFLYTTSTGLHLTLTSPQFVCRKGEVIDMDVTWITTQWQEPDFVVSKVALTAALLNENGVTVDSVTFVPTKVGRVNQIPLSITVPRTMSKARLRFAAWKGDVNSSGAVRQIVMSSTLSADVVEDGEVNIADINAIIAAIFGQVDPDMMERADVNRDGEVNVQDINVVIAIILG